MNDKHQDLTDICAQLSVLRNQRKRKCFFFLMLILVIAVESPPQLCLFASTAPTEKTTGRQPNSMENSLVYH